MKKQQIATDKKFARGNNLFIMFHLLLDLHQLRWVQKKLARCMIQPENGISFKMIDFYGVCWSALKLWFMQISPQLFSPDLLKDAVIFLCFASRSYHVNCIIFLTKIYNLFRVNSFNLNSNLHVTKKYCFSGGHSCVSLCQTIKGLINVRALKRLISWFNPI